MTGQDPSDGGAPERVDVESRGGDSRPESALEWLRWLVRTDDPAVSFGREVIASIVGVLLVGLLLFAVSGIWPPMVAVESGSMEPHMYRGDLVFVMEEHRLAPSFAGGTGVVTLEDAAAADRYRKFGGYGDVIVFEANGGTGTPVIHRAHFWVDNGENWVREANPEYLPSGRSCSAVPNCPAPHAGFVTKGDNNELYDQVAGISGPVRPSWIKGTAEFRIPWLGYVRLYFTELGTRGATPIVTTSAVVGVAAG